MKTQTKGTTINEVFKDKEGTIPAYQVYVEGEFLCEAESRSKAETIVRAVNRVETYEALLKKIVELNLDDTVGGALLVSIKEALK